MPLFKKPSEGFLAKLFRRKQVDELAQELANNYAEDMLADQEGQTTSAECEIEPVPMLEVTDTGEVDFDASTVNVEDESPPQDDADSTKQSTHNPEVRNHLITFRVNDDELAAINRRYAETSFKSRGDFCRYSALTVMNIEEDTEDIKSIARYLSSMSNSFNQIAFRVNKTGKVYDDDISEIKETIELTWQLLTSIRSTRERTMQLLISATQTKPQTANMLLATCAYLLHTEHQNNSEKQESLSGQDSVEMKPST